LYSAKFVVCLYDFLSAYKISSGEVMMSYRFFTALHVMQTRYCDENSVRLSAVCLSVRLSVRPSVTRVYCDKTVEKSVQIYIPYERTFSLVF